MAAGFGSENGQLTGDIERKPVLVTKAATSMVAALGGTVTVVTAPTQISRRVDLATLLLIMKTMVRRKLKVAMRPRPWSLIIESLIEKVIFILSCNFA